MWLIQVSLPVLNFRGNDFRPQYRRLGQIRSFLPEDVRFLALTATATKKIKEDVCKSLLMIEPCMLKILSGRHNIYYEVKVSKRDDFSGLNWIVKMLKNDQREAPKSIVFCRNVKTVALVFDYISYKLGESQFINGDIKFQNRLIAMFHRSTADVNKNFVLAEFKKSNSVIRFVVATSSFEMGLDFADVTFVVNYAAPRSLESFSQQSGRGGREIDQAFSLIIYQAANVGKGSTTSEMRNFITNKSFCRRKILKAHFSIEPGNEDLIFENTTCAPKKCKCCDICREKCDCGDCLMLPWSSKSESDEPNENVDKSLDAEADEGQIDILRGNLEDYKLEMLSEMGMEHSYPNILLDTFESVIDRLLLSCRYIMSIEDIMSETGVNDLSVAEDLFSLVSEVLGSNDE